MRAFTPSGLLALEPQAFGLIMLDASKPSTAVHDSVAVINVRGPLMHHRSFWWDSYDELLERVDAALVDAPKAIILKIDSPGGVVAGAFESAAALREKCDAAGVPLFAFVEGTATSAAYALAAAADEIVASPTSMVGSIGVISALVDRTKLNEEIGLNFTIVASGARKADGHPDIPTSEGAVAATQQRINQMAEAFFAHVASRRDGLEVDAIRDLQARVMLGAEAVSLGLIDGLETFDSLLARASGNLPASAGSEETETMDEEEEKARKALQAILDDDDATEDEKGRARNALKALDPDDDDAAEDEKDDAEDKDTDDAKSEDEKDDDEAKVSAKAGAALASQVAELMRDKEEREKAELFASRPDLDENLVKVLSSMPIADARKIVAATPRRATKTAAASSTTPATRGVTPPGTAPELADDDLGAKMDQAMGLTKLKPGVKKEGTTLYLGASVPETSNPGAGK